MSLENKNQSSTPHARLKYHLQSDVEYCTFWQLTTKGRTPVQLTVRRRILRSCRSVGNSFFLPHSRKIRKTPLAPKECKLRSKTTIVHCLAPPKNRARNLCRSQASKTECSESGANCVRGSWTVSTIANTQDNGRIQRHNNGAATRQLYWWRRTR